jgi:hypothetical protein
MKQANQKSVTAKKPKKDLSAVNETSKENMVDSSASLLLKPGTPA